MNKKELMYKENTPGYIIELKDVSNKINWNYTFTEYFTSN